MPRPSASLPARLHDEVDVIALDRVVADAELAALAAAAQPDLELADEAPTSQRRHLAPNPQRHVGRTAARDLRPLHVMDRRPRGGALRPAPARLPPWVRKTISICFARHVDIAN